MSWPASEESLWLRCIHDNGCMRAIQVVMQVLFDFQRSCGLGDSIVDLGTLLWTWRLYYDPLEDNLTRDHIAITGDL